MQLLLVFILGLNSEADLVKINVYMWYLIVFYDTDERQPKPLLHRHMTKYKLIYCIL